MQQTPGKYFKAAFLFGTKCWRICNYSTSIRHSILNETQVSSNHLTPEIKLRLITPSCNLWSSREDECPFSDPFWAFYWPGGQALTRYILDGKASVEGRRVLDVGSGCGSSSIAASLRGARVVTANDICPVAAEAIRINADLNNCNLDINTCDLIGENCSQWDTVFLGDMFYDPVFTNKVFDWLVKLCAHGKRIFIGDPGRLSFLQHPLHKRLVQLASYDLPCDALKENNGMTKGNVWTFD